MKIDRTQLHAFSGSTQWQQLKELMLNEVARATQNALSWDGQKSELAVSRLLYAQASRDFAARLIAAVERPLDDAAPQETYFETPTAPRSIKELKEWQKSKRPTTALSQ